MMLRALTADLLKARRKGIWFLVFLGPLGLVLCRRSTLDFDMTI